MTDKSLLHAVSRSRAKCQHDSSQNVQKNQWEFIKTHPKNIWQTVTLIVYGWATSIHLLSQWRSAFMSECIYWTPVASEFTRTPRNHNSCCSISDTSPSRPFLRRSHIVQRPLTQNGGVKQAALSNLRRFREHPRTYEHDAEGLILSST